MKTVAGLSASPGFAVGPLFVYRPPTVRVEHYAVDDLESELARYEATRAGVARDLGKDCRDRDPARGSGRCCR